MTSEDVIHDFSVPAFRVKHDVLPGRYETLWFRADKPGTYHLFCTRFCGTDHAKMIGEIVVDAGAGLPEMAGAERHRTIAWCPRASTLFMRYGCSGCHGGPRHRARALAGRPLRQPRAALRRNHRASRMTATYATRILAPEKQVVASYAPVMPSFAGQISEEDLLKLIAYIKSLAPEKTVMSTTVIEAREIEVSYLNGRASASQAGC